MNKRATLKKQIQKSEEEIEALEKKRVRSQSALLEAFINHTTPAEADVEYFRVFTSLIKLERENLRKLNAELEKLGG